MEGSEKVCGTCGCNPCMGICPENGPYAGNQAAEEADYSLGARYDRWDGYDQGDLHYSSAEEADYYLAPKINVGGIAMTAAEFERYINRPTTKVPLPIDPNDIPF